MTNRVNKLIVLGSGTSTGIPLLGCACPVCTHPDKKNKRLRSSIFLETAKGRRILIDAGPDLRTQLLREKITHIDAVFITHRHGDHCIGLDELRPLSAHRPLPVYSDPATCQILTKRFDYIFERDRKKTSYTAQLELKPLAHLPSEPGTLGEPVEIEGESFQFFFNPHGTIQTLAFIHHKMAYIIDCHEIHPSLRKELKDKQLDLLIIDCASRSPHKTHLHFEQTLSYHEDISPKRCALTHLNHDFEHNELTKELDQRFSSQVISLFDGQVLKYGLECRR